MSAKEQPRKPAMPVSRRLCVFETPPRKAGCVCSAANKTWFASRTNSLHEF